MASLVPIDATHSSYNGLILLVFIAFSATLVAASSISSARERCAGPGLGRGYPDPSPRTQYSASGAQPLRRVFGETCRRPATRSTCRGPARSRRGSAVSWHDLVWERLTGRGRGGAGGGPAQRSAVPDRPPLPDHDVRGTGRCSAWSRRGADPRPRPARHADAILHLPLARRLGCTASARSARAAPPRPVAAAGLPRSPASAAQGRGSAGERVVAVPTDAYASRRLGGGRPGPTLPPA